MVNFVARYSSYSHGQVKEIKSLKIPLRWIASALPLINQIVMQSRFATGYVTMSVRIKNTFSLHKVITVSFIITFNERWFNNLENKSECLYFNSNFSI